MVSRNAAPLPVYGTGMAAQHVAHQRPARGRPPAGRRRDRQSRRSADRSKRALSRAVGFERAIFSRAHRVGGQTLVPRQLRQLRLPADARAARSAARCPIASFRCLLLPFPAAAATSADQRLAIAAPRSGAMVAVPDLLRPVGLVFSQRRSLQQSAQRHRLRHVDQHGQLSQSGRRRADSLDVHDAFHLSDDQPGRPLLLDRRPAADRSRHDLVEQILVRVARLVDSLLAAWCC